MADTTATPPATTIPTPTTLPPSADAVEVMVFVFGPHDADDVSYECGAVTPVRAPHGVAQQC